MRSVMAGQRAWLPANRKQTMSSVDCWDAPTCVRLEGMSVCTGLYFERMGQAFEGVCCGLFSYLIVCMKPSGCGCICLFICRLLCVCLGGLEGRIGRLKKRNHGLKLGMSQYFLPDYLCWN